MLSKYFYKNIRAPYLCSCELYPLSIEKGFKKNYKDYSNRKRVKFSKGRYTYHGLKGMVTRSKSIIDDELLDVIERKRVKNVGKLRTDSTSSFYLGRHIVRDGDRVQKFYRSGDPFLEYYHQHSADFNKFGINVDKSIVVGGCFKTNKETLQRTMTPDKNTLLSQYPNNKIFKKLFPAVRILLRKLKIKTIDASCIDDMVLFPYNKDTYAGFTYDKYLHKRTKGECFNDALYMAERRWKNIDKRTKKGETVERKDLYPSTYTIGARNKRDYDYAEGDILTSRAVHMPEFHVELNSSVWVDPITEQIKDAERGPIYIGNSIVDYQRLYSDTRNAVNVLEGDLRRFDSRLYINLIICAVAISRCYYDIHDECIDNHFTALFDSVGIKDYYTPGGYIYRMIHGLPSGVKSTSLFGSFINLLMQIYFNLDKDNKRINYCIGGDDLLIIYFSLCPTNLISTLILEAEKIGWEFKFLVSKNVNADAISDLPVFYKYCICGMKPITPTVNVLERVFLPWNKRYKTDADILKFLIDLMPTLGHPGTHLFHYYNFYCYMYRRVFSEEITLGDVITRQTDLFNKVINDKIPLWKDESKGTITIKDFANVNVTSLYKAFGLKRNGEIRSQRKRHRGLKAVIRYAFKEKKNVNKVYDDIQPGILYI